MKTVILFCMVVLLVASSSLNATEIELKKSFWSGPKYSIDGGPFLKVGMSGDGLYQAFEGNGNAQQLLLKYKSRKMIATVTGVVGGLLVGWLAGSALADNYKDEYDTWLAIAIPFTVVSIGYEIAASSSLNSAVQEYNDGEFSIGLDLNYRKLASTDRNAVVVGFAIKF